MSNPEAHTVMYVVLSEHGPTELVALFVQGIILGPWEAVVDKIHPSPHGADILWREPDC